jgi:hypothetical protein
VYAAGPRLEQRFLERVVQLDDDRLPMAETYRRIRGLAEEMGVPRPSYERVRLQLKAARRSRQDRAQARELVLELAFDSRPADVVIGDLLGLLE